MINKQQKTTTMNTLGKISIILMACVAAVSCGSAARISTEVRTKTGIVAHRGFWNCEEAGYAKNSIAALRCAQEAGFRGSEFDVNMTSDGELIVYHDSKIEGKQIEKYPYSEFKDFKIKNGETIPTIDQYLEQGKKYPGTMLVYELKPHSSDEVEDRFAELTIRKLREHELLDPKRVMFISFSFHICKVLAEKLPGFTVQYLEGNKRPSKVKEAGISGIDYHYTILNINKGWIDEAHKLGMTVNAWTVNKEEPMRSLLEKGIDFITTDNPLDARELMKEMKAMETR